MGMNALHLCIGKAVWICWLNPARINNPSTTNQLYCDPQSPRVLTIKARYFPSTRTARPRSLRPLFLPNGGLFWLSWPPSRYAFFRQLAVTNAAPSLNPAPLGPRTFQYPCAARNPKCTIAPLQYSRAGAPTLPVPAPRPCHCARTYRR
jgi:hypothetical protein